MSSIEIRACVKSRTDRLYHYDPGVSIRRFYNSFALLVRFRLIPTSGDYNRSIGRGIRSIRDRSVDSSIINGTQVHSHFGTYSTRCAKWRSCFWYHPLNSFNVAHFSSSKFEIRILWSGPGPLSTSTKGVAFLATGHYPSLLYYLGYILCQ